jgi:dihydrofolate synthase/folylpolyglutamate synthase
MNIFEARKYIAGFPKMGEPVTSLNRFADLCAKFGNPQNKLRFIHVAGTNGKGSTVRMIAEVLLRSGYITGEYSSPYVKEWNDRIRVGGMNIPDSALVRIVEYVKPIFDMEVLRYSQFELATIIAFIYFADQNCDIVVLETGIGGLLDCTNVVKTTIVSVITSVSLDHTMILGDTIEAITAQKAGIIKPGTAAVLYPDNSPAAERIVLKAALDNDCAFIKPEKERLTIKQYGIPGAQFRYKGKKYDIRMAGKHQIYNAVTAIETLEYLRRIGFDKIKYSFEYEGLHDAYLMSRCQIIHEKPLIILDGAHNPDGMRKLAEFVRRIKDRPKIMVVGMREDKDYETALSEICRYIDIAVCVDGFIPQTVNAEKLAAIFRKGQVSPISEAVRKAIALAGEDGMVIIGGSLYLAEALNKYMD